MSATTLKPAVRVAASRLAQSPLFAGLPPTALRGLASTASAVRIDGGSILFEEGDEGTDLFVVMRGRLEVLAQGGDAHLGWVGPNGLVGERALLDGGRRCATVRAIRDSELLRLSGSGLERLFMRHPAVLRRISATVAGRAADREDGATFGTRSIAVIATGGTERWRVTQLCGQLAAALRTVGPSIVVDETADLDALDDHDQGFVIYEAAGIASPWTRACLRQADHVLLVGDSTSDPRPSLREQPLIADTARAGVPRALVLVHPGSTPTPGTSRWLEGRDVDGWHHLTADPSSTARVARHLAGTSVGLVLGGGGARGLAHLGVLAALEDAGVPVDAVGGTSIGAIMGAFAALGWSDERRRAVARSGFVETRRLVGRTLPLLSLSSSKTLTRLLREHAGDAAIEDLPVPFFCVSANYSTGETMVHDRGPLWWALRASISLPGVLPPVYAAGDLLVDGGVMNNLPVDVMQARRGGPVIAVDLRSRPAPRTIPEFDPTLSGWQVLARRLHPGRRSLPLPGPAATMLRAKELGGKDAHRLRRAAADLLLEPPVDGVDSLDFRAALPLTESAFTYTLGMLAADPSLVLCAPSPG